MSRDNGTGSNTSSNDHDDNDERNPFVAFRRFADEQFNTAARGFGDISSLFGDVMKSYEKAERDARMHWKKFEDHYERAMNPERKRLEGKDDIQTAAAASAIAGRCGKEAPPRSQQSSSGMWHASAPFCPRSGFGFSRGAEPEREPKTQDHEEWLGIMKAPIYYHDPYSPVYLEKAKELKGCPVNWRRAFEDLVNVQQRQALTDPQRQRRLVPGEFLKPEDLWAHIEFRGHPYESQPVTGSGKQRDYIRGSEGSSNKSNDDSSGLDTELDMYEQFLGRQLRSASSTPAGASSSALIPPASQPSKSQTSAGTTSFSSRLPSSSRQEEQKESSQSPGPASTLTDQRQPSVIATISTTERYMQADGTVTTKTLLKRRFADGTERSEESSNTSHVPLRDLRWPRDAGGKLSALPRAGTQLQQSSSDSLSEAAPKKSSSSGSWFWSS